MSSKLFGRIKKSGWKELLEGPPSGAQENFFSDFHQLPFKKVKPKQTELE